MYLHSILEWANADQRDEIEERLTDTDTGATAAGYDEGEAWASFSDALHNR